MAIAVDDCDRHDGDESVERVERRKLELVLVNHNDAKSDLNKDREFSDACVPPQCSGTKGRDLVRSKRPHTGETIADDRNPGPRLMNVEN